MNAFLWGAIILLYVLILAYPFTMGKLMISRDVQALRDNLEIERQLILLVEDMVSTSPQLEEGLSVTLHDIREMERRHRRQLPIAEKYAERKFISMNSFGNYSTRMFMARKGS